MPKIFISYTHVMPDQELALQLRDALEKNGLDVFLDTKIGIGQNWAEQIDTELRKATHFVVLLSAASIESDMVRREIAIAHRLRRAKQLSILPVRLNLPGELPYDLAAYLDLIQYTSWRDGQRFDTVCSTIINGIGLPSPLNGSVTKPVEVKRFAKEELEAVTARLARHLGPMARLIVNDAAKTAGSWDDLCSRLADELPNAEERRAFLATCCR
jgi:hypothetical protein